MGRREGEAGWSERLAVVGRVDALMGKGGTLARAKRWRHRGLQLEGEDMRSGTAARLGRVTASRQDEVHQAGAWAKEGRGRRAVMPDLESGGEAATNIGLYLVVGQLSRDSAWIYVQTAAWLQAELECEFLC